MLPSPSNSNVNQHFFKFAITYINTSPIKFSRIPRDERSRSMVCSRLQSVFERSRSRVFSKRTLLARWVLDVCKADGTNNGWTAAACKSLAKQRRLLRADTGDFNVARSSLPFNFSPTTRRGHKSDQIQDRGDLQPNGIVNTRLDWDPSSSDFLLSAYTILPICLFI